MTSLPGLPVLTAAQVLMDHSLFWTPDYLSRSAGQMQVPLVFWLTDLLRPKCTVSLGGAEGVVHAAVCQAVKRLALGCECYVHLPQPASERFMHHFRKTYGEQPQLLPGLTELPEQSVNFLTVHVTDGARAEEIDWNSLHQKLSPEGVCLIYGPALDRLPCRALRGPEPLLTLRLGQREMTALLLLAPEAPEILRNLADVADDDSSEKTGLEALLSHQAQYLDQAALIRDLPPLLPDPTAPEFPEPRSLEEARAQIAQLVEVHASDLETLAARLDQQSALQGTRDAEHRAELERLEMELERKDAMLEVLNQRLAELHAAEHEGRMTDRQQASRGWLRRALRPSR